jgi:hypothetical protein
VLPLFRITDIYILSQIIPNINLCPQAGSSFCFYFFQEKEEKKLPQNDSTL